MQKKRLLLLGGGHANAQIVLDWNETSSSTEQEMTLLSDGESAFYSGMCPGFVAGLYRRSQLALNLPKLCASKGFTFINGSVRSIDARSNTLFYSKNDSDGVIQSIEYDVLSIDIGSQSLGTSLPGVSEHAITTRPLSSLEAKLSAAAESLVEDCRLLVVGGGAASVEMALALQTRFQHLQPNTALVTSSSVLLPDENAQCRSAVLRALQRRSVSVGTRRRVVGVQPRQAQLDDGTSVEFDVLVWATGAEAHDVVTTFDGIELTSRHFLRVNEYLQSISRPNVFAGGDCMELVALPLAKCGVYAVRAGPVLLHNVRAVLHDQPLRAFEPQNDFLRLINCSDGSAIGSKFGVAFEGRWTFRLKDWIDRSWMRRFSAGLDDDVELAEPLHAIAAGAHRVPSPPDAARLLRDTEGDEFDAQWIVLGRMHEDVQYRQQVLQHLTRN